LASTSALRTKYWPRSKDRSRSHYTSASGLRSPRPDHGLGHGVGLHFNAEAEVEAKNLTLKSSRGQSYTLEADVKRSRPRP